MLFRIYCLTAALFVALPLFAQEYTAKLIIGEELGETGKPQPGKLHTPFGVDFDATGNMFIVELDGGRVHKLDTAGKFATIAGNGEKSYTGDGGPASKATFNGMHNVAVTPAGDAYIADSWNHCIRKIDAKTGVITTIAGTGEPGFSGDGGPATKATFNFIMCITLDAANESLLVADLKNRRIRKVDLKTGVVTTVAGNGKRGVPTDGARATDSPLVDPRAVASDSSGNIYILERGGHALRRVSPAGEIHTVVGTGKAGTATGAALSSQLNGPKHIAIDHDDNVIIADEQNQRICKYNAREKTLTTILGAGVPSPRVKLSKPHGVCVHEDGSIYVVDTGHHRIFRLSPLSQ